MFTAPTIPLHKASNQFCWFYALPVISLGIICLTCLPLFNKPYPDLGSFLPFFGFMIAPLLLLFLAPLVQIISIELLPDHVRVRKGFGQLIQIPYTDIVGYTERPAGNRWGKQKMELTIYGTDDWFTLPETGFRDYNKLKAILNQFGKPTRYRQAFSITESAIIRSLILLFIGFLALNTWYGYAAYTPTTTTGPVRLQVVDGVVASVKVHKNKGSFKGISFRLREYDQVFFYARKANFTPELQTLPYRVGPSTPIQLTIRASEYAKKLAQTTPLSFGDKVDQYNEITLYGINVPTVNRPVALRTIGEIKEDTHTRPILWVLGGVAGLLMAWTCWVWVSRQQLGRIVEQINHSA